MNKYIMEYKPINNISLDYNNVIIGAITNWDTNNNINITINITMKTTPNFYIDLVDTNNINIYYLRINQNNYKKINNTYNLELSNINKNSVNSLNYINKLNTTNNNNFNVKITPIIEQDTTSNKYKPLLIDSININIEKSNNLLTNNININNKIQNGLKSSIKVSQLGVQNNEIEDTIGDSINTTTNRDSCKSKKIKNYNIKNKIYKIENIYYIFFLFLCLIFGFFNGVSVNSDANTRYYDFIKKNKIDINKSESLIKPSSEITIDPTRIKTEELDKLQKAKHTVQQKIDALMEDIIKLKEDKKSDKIQDIYLKLQEAQLKKEKYVRNLNGVSQSILKLEKEIKEKK